MQLWQLERADGTGRVAGVCSGIATRWAIDPMLVRIAAVLLSLWGGLGLVLYGAAWALLPIRGRRDAPLFRAFPGLRQVPTAAVLVVVAGLAVGTMAVLSSVLPVGPGALIIVGVLWYVFVYRRQQRVADDDAAGLDPARTASGDHATGQPTPGHPTTGRPGRAADAPAEPIGWSDHLPPVVPQAARTDRPTPDPAFFSHPDPAGLYGEQAGEPPTTAPRPRSTTSLARRVRRWGLVAALAAVLVLAVIDAVGPTDIPFAAYPSLALLMIGITLVVSAWAGRARGVLPLAVVLLLTTMAGLTTTSGGADPAAMGESRTYTTVASLPDDRRDDFEFGSAVIDLSGFTATQDLTYRVSMETGSLRVVLPRGMRAEVVAEVETGNLQLAGQGQASGLELQRRASYGTDLDGPVLTVHVEAETGSVEVIR